MMRRMDREVTEFDELTGILSRCDVVRLALNRETGYPYLLPLNFGMAVKDGKLTLYFHSALEGEKVSLMKKDPRASFEADGRHELEYKEEGGGYCTYHYESVIGYGRIRILPEEEKFEALTALMDHYYPGQKKPFNPAAMSRTLVYALDVEAMSGKRKSRPKAHPEKGDRNV